MQISLCNQISKQILESANKTHMQLVEPLKLDSIIMTHKNEKTRSTKQSDPSFIAVPNQVTL